VLVEVLANKVGVITSTVDLMAGDLPSSIKVYCRFGDKLLITKLRVLLFNLYLTPFNAPLAPIMLTVWLFGDPFLYLQFSVTDLSEIDAVISAVAFFLTAA
jgi:hypothetical protein